MIRRTTGDGKNRFLVIMAAIAVVIMAACAAEPTPTPAQPPSSPVGPTATSTAVPKGGAPTATIAPSPAIPLDRTAGPAATPTLKSASPPITSTLSANAERTSTPVPTATPAPVSARHFPDAPDRDLYELARALLLKTGGSISPVVNPNPVSYAQGRRDIFQLTDLLNVKSYTSQATLRLVTPHAYWYVEDGVEVSQTSLVESARTFEEEIYPKVTAVFGTEWTPGVDNDPHITILHARLRGVAGYFSSADEYPASVHQLSNQREMMYMNTALRVGSGRYLAVLAHELQHAIHWNGDPSEETWVNEGLSEVAASVAGYRPSHQDVFVGSPTVSLVNWPDQVATYYGAAFLFFDYLVSHYGGIQDIGLLVSEAEDGIAGIDAYLSNRGYDTSFRDVFKDWVVANYLDEPGGGPYSYPDNNVKLRATGRLEEFGGMESSIPQYSAEYTALNIGEGNGRLRFEGQKQNRLLPVSLEESGCWWSNRGDSIGSTLSRRLDLSGVDRATLNYRTWFDVEEDWDYAYVLVSTDGGSTWDVIQAPGTSPGNPVGNSFGPGYTGRSNGWLEESVDLTGYAGQDAFLRFQYVTDDAINGMGICIDDISVPEIGFFDGDGRDGGWQAEGFLRVDNEVPQDYIVQLIEVGDSTRVREMILDEDNRGELVISERQGLDEVVVVVAALAPGTLQDARYTLLIEPVP